MLENDVAYIESAAMLRVVESFGRWLEGSGILPGIVPVLLRDPVDRWTARRYLPRAKAE